MMIIHPLPKNPNLDNLKKRAKSLLKAAHAKDPEALALVGPYFGTPSEITLQSAQLVLARYHGYSSWLKLKKAVEQPASPGSLDTDQLANQFLELVTVDYTVHDAPGPTRFARAQDMLVAHPEIATENICTAAAIGDVDQLQWWLTKTPSLVNQKGGCFHWEPLMYAAYSRLPDGSTFEGAQCLLERGANPNAYYMWNGECKFTALTGVFGEGERGPVNQPEHPDCLAFARVMLEHGADPSDDQAIYNRMFEAGNDWLRLLLEFAGPLSSDVGLDQTTVNTNPPKLANLLHSLLIQSIRSGYGERATLLIDAGVDVNAVDSYYDTRTKGRTPVQAARLMGHSEIADYLVANGAHDSAESPEDAFQAACMNGHTAVARKLLNETPGLAQVVRPVQRALLCDAVSLRNYAALTTMIDLDFALNYSDARSPLHDSAYNGDLRAVELLLKAGADPTLRDARFLTPPIVFALYSGNEEVIQLLDSVDMDVFTAASRGKLERISACLEKNPACANQRFGDIRPSQERDNPTDWATPLVFAIWNNRADAVRLLLKNGARTDISNDSDQSVLTAADACSDETIQQLILKGST